MTPSPDQLRRALENTRRAPRNHAPEVEQARRNTQQRPTPEWWRAYERMMRNGGRGDG